MRLLNKARHRRWRRDLSAYMDGRLAIPRRDALERHLAECAFCQEELASLRGVIAMLRRMPQVEAPRSFALSQAPSAVLRWPELYVRPLRYATAVAAMLLVAVVVGDLLTARPPALGPASPGVAETQTKEVPEKLQGTPSTATFAPLAGEQDLAQATPTPQSLPFVAAEKALEAADAVVPPSTLQGEPGTLHNWLRWAEVGLGAILAALVTVAAAQWWLGHRQRER